jgi:hypothetical protein
MPDLVSSALAATRESRRIEFKQSFDPASAGEWCELIKDIVALANSGGGIIVFGLDSRGTPTTTPVKSVLAVDPADLTNRMFRYTGCADFDIEIRQLQKAGISLAHSLSPLRRRRLPLRDPEPTTSAAVSRRLHSASEQCTFGTGARANPQRQMTFGMSLSALPIASEKNGRGGSGRSFPLPPEAKW